MKKGRTLKLRSITKHVKDQNWFAVFLDFIIVVAGILIAFQITNLSQTRQENLALDSYLTSISKNIEFDLSRLDTLRKKRIGIMSQARFMTDDPFASSTIDRATVEASSEIFRYLTNYEYFETDKSAFDTFKSSGLLKNIQGQDLESLIFRYYNLAQEIAKKETDYNQTLKDRFNVLSNKGLEGMIYVMYPNFIAGAGQLEMIQPLLSQALHDPAAIGVYTHTYNKSPELIIRYDNLAILGREIVGIVSNAKGNFDRTSSDSLDELFDLDGDYGYGQPILNGTLITRFYEWGHASSNGQYMKITPGLTEHIITAPDTDWSVSYIRNRSDVFSERPAKNFSKFQLVKLTLRGGVGGEKVLIAMKDSTDLDDGLETRIPLTLTSDWKTYQIPLSRFETAELSNIFIPISFIFLDGETTISVRDIEFAQ